MRRNFDGLPSIVGEISIIVSDAALSILDPDALAEYPVAANPAVDPASVVSDLISVASDRLDEVKVVVAPDLAQNDVSDAQYHRIADGLNRAKLTRGNLPRHRVPSWPE